MKDWVIRVLENYMEQRHTCGGGKCDVKKFGNEKFAEMINLISNIYFY